MELKISDRLKLPLVVLLIYSLLSLVLTWPVVAQLGSSIPGKIGDSFVHLWTYSFIKDALLAGESPYSTNLLFFPVGANLLNHNIPWLNIAAWLPLQELLGPEISYSIVHLISFPFNGIAFFILAYQVTRSKSAAFVGGLIAGFWPYNLSHFDHPNLILTGWLSLALLFLSRAMLEQRIRDAMLAGLFIALLGITRWQLLIMSSFMLAMFVGYLVLTNEAARTLRALRLLALTGMVAFLIMAPLLLPILEYQVMRENPSDIIISEEEPYSTDLLAYLVPNRHHPLWGKTVNYATAQFTGNNLYTRSIGYTVLALTLLAIVKRFRDSLFWFCAALVYLLLSLGPELYIFGRPYLTLPYKLIENVWFMQLVRFPDRYNVILSIPIAMLSAFGVAVLTANRQRRQLLLRTAVISVLIVFEYSMVYKMLPLYTPTWYEKIAEEPGQFALLDIPMRVQSYDTYYGYYQLTHGKPLVEGHVSRPSREMTSFIESVPLLSNLSNRLQPPSGVLDTSRQLRMLHDADVRYLILHKQFLGDDDLKAWREWLVTPPLHDDDDLIVYETRALNVGSELPFQTTFLDAVGNDYPIGLLDAAIIDPELRPGSWVQVNAAWGNDRPVDSEVEACLELATSTAETVASTCHSLSATYPPDLWQDNTIVHDTHSLLTSPFLPEGLYDVQLYLVSDGHRLSAPATVGSVKLSTPQRVYELPEVDHRMSVKWAEQIALRGYSKTLTSESLTLSLYWQALERMDSSYKFFVHLVDATTGQIVAQIDTVPRDWSYPTNWWDLNEVVEDELSLSLVDVPPGEYSINIGIYDPETSERLPLVLQDGSGTADNVLTLETISH